MTEMPSPYNPETEINHEAESEEITKDRLVNFNGDLYKVDRITENGKVSIYDPTEGPSNLILVEKDNLILIPKTEGK